MNRTGQSAPRHLGPNHTDRSGKENSRTNWTNTNEI